MNQVPNDEASDLDWLAFRYAAGELPAEEAQALERHMAEDQALREAVSRAVALGLVLAAARSSGVEPVAGRAITGKRQLRIAWAGFALAASMLVSLGAFWSWSGQGHSPHPGSTASRSVAPSATADAWLQLYAGDHTTRQLERHLSDWEQDEVSDTQVRRHAVVPRWLIEVAMTDAKKGKNE